MLYTIYSSQSDCRINNNIALSQVLQKQLGAKHSTLKAVGKAGNQLLSQKTGEDGELLKKKLEDLEQKWGDVCTLSADWQQKLEKTRAELSK